MPVVELRKNPDKRFKREPEWLRVFSDELVAIVKRHPQVREDAQYSAFVNYCKDCGKLISIVVREHYITPDADVQCGGCYNLENGGDE